MRDGRGDRESFGLIFDRDVEAVFAAALDVVDDSAVAAELAIEAFAAAWERSETEGLVDAARDRARAWVDRGGVAKADEGSGFDPVWRARIVAALEVQGIPTRAPQRRPRRRPTRKPGPPVLGRPGWLVGGTGRRVVVGVAAGALAVVGLTAVGGDPAAAGADAAFATADRAAVADGTATGAGAGAAGVPGDGHGARVALEVGSGDARRVIPVTRCGMRGGWGGGGA